MALTKEEIAKLKPAYIDPEIREYFDVKGEYKKLGLRYFWMDMVYPNDIKKETELLRRCIKEKKDIMEIRGLSWGEPLPPDCVI